MMRLKQLMKGKLLDAEVRKNPSDHLQWFIMLKDDQNKSFVLVDGEETPIVCDDLNRVTVLIKDIGLKEFSVFL